MKEKEMHVSISWHPLKRYVKIPQILRGPLDMNIIDVIYQIDKQYFKNRKNSKRSHRLDFMAPKIKSSLQMLWNPETGMFYDDVGVECRTPPPESRTVPVEIEWKTPVPNNAWIVLMPDAQC
ncbi:hypothetical protein [Candidatus Harpocratesius sp.]